MVPCENNTEEHDQDNSCEDSLLFGFQSSSEDYASRDSFTLPTLVPSSPNESFLFALPEALIQLILEYIYQDYQSLRLVCRESCRLFDELIFRRVLMHFYDPESDLLVDLGKHKFQTIKLAEILFTLLLPNCRDKRKKGLQRCANSLLKRVKRINRDNFYRLISILLKLKIIFWIDIEGTFLHNFEAVKACYSLGLLLIVKLLTVRSPSLFSTSIGHEQKGLLIAIRNNHYRLARYIVETVGSNGLELISNFPEYFNKIIEELVKVEYWDLLETLYISNSSFNYREHLRPIAYKGSLVGLRILRFPFRMNPRGIGYIAASMGHLHFLKELNHLGILVKAAGPDESNETALHAAAFFGHLDCLQFLLETVGTDWLNLADKNGYMPIHLAAQTGKIDSLSRIIELNPHYRDWNPLKNFFFGFISPLHAAVASNQIEACRILLQNFPELISAKDKKHEDETALHMAINNSSLELVEFILETAPDWIIKARNRKGDTALHLACKYASFDKILALIETNLFTGTERNVEGSTPVGILVLRYPFYTPGYFLNLFKLSQEEFDEAVLCKPPNLILQSFRRK